MGWLDGILGSKETPKETKKVKPKAKKTKTESKIKKVEPKTKKEIVAKGPAKKIKTKTKTTWTKGKLDKLSTSELHKVAKEHNVKIDGLTKTQIYSKIVKG